MSHCKGPIPPRSKPYAIGFEVSPDKGKIRAHTIRIESFEVSGPAAANVEFELLRPDIDDERIKLLWKHVGANKIP